MATQIRLETAADSEAVRAVLSGTFGRSSEADLVDRLRVRPDVFSLVGAVDDRVVGHVIFTPVEVVGGKLSRPAIALALLAVLPEFRSQGIGGRLVIDGLEESRRRGMGLVFVIGPAALYVRFGFVPAMPLGVRCRWRAKPETFRVVELVPGEIARAQGIVRYLPEFSAA